MPRTYVVGTRGSKLALRQVEIVSALLRRAHLAISIEVRQITTQGDSSDAPLSAIGGLGVFTKAIEDALLRGDCDIAVHSLKDLPSVMTPGLVLAAVPEREDPRDALITRNGATLDALPPGARIGTGSGRRAAQLLAMRPDVRPDDIRGNVDTRIRKVLDGAYDGAVLALAGLLRLGLEEQAAQVFTIEEMLPAVAQAALGVQTRAADRDAIAVCRAIDHAESRVAVEAERAFLARLGAGCRTPAAAYATVAGGTMTLRGMIAEAPLMMQSSEAPPLRLSEGGLGGEVPPRQYRATITAPAGDPAAAGVALAEALFAQGAAVIVADAGGAP